MYLQLKSFRPPRALILCAAALSLSGVAARRVQAVENIDPQAVALLQKADAALKAAPSLSASVDLKRDIGFQQVHNRFRFVYTLARPSFIENHTYDYAGTGKPHLVTEFVSNGKKLSSYGIASNIYSIQDASPQTVQDSSTGLRPFNGYFTAKDSILVHVQELHQQKRLQSIMMLPNATVSGTSCSVIEMKYAEDPDLPEDTLKHAPGGATIAETIFLGPDHLVRRIREAHNVGASLDYLVTRLTVGKPLTSALFVVTRPKGAKDPAPVRSLLAVGSSAPDFSALASDGTNMVKLSNYRGKIIVLDFWATWCGPCQVAMPHLERVYNEVKDKNVVVLGICVWDDKAAYNKWVAEKKDKYTFATAYDPAGRRGKSIASTLYNVSGIPTQYVIGPDGKIAAVLSGELGPNDHRLEAVLHKLGVDTPPATPVPGS